MSLQTPFVRKTYSDLVCPELGTRWRFTFEHAHETNRLSEQHPTAGRQRSQPDESLHGCSMSTVLGVVCNVSRPPPPLPPPPPAGEVSTDENNRAAFVKSSAPSVRTSVRLSFLHSVWSGLRIVQLNAHDRFISAACFGRC